MSIITISRGTFSGGKAIAECLAGRLGYDCISREILIDAAEKYGVSAEVLASAVDKAPRFLDRLGRHRDAYIAFFTASLCEFAQRGKIVYHGHAGHFLLTGVQHVLRVRVVAPIEFRIDAAMTRLSSNRAEAIAHIERVDRERARWTQFLYGVAWEDPHHYDLVLNLEKMSIETACGIVADAIARPDFTPTEESLDAMRKLAVKSRVVAALAADHQTSDAHVDVLVEGDVVTLQGFVRMQSSLDAIVGVVEPVEGVGRVECHVVVRSGFPI